MKTIGEEAGGLKPDLHCLSAAIDAAGGAGEWEAALRLLGEMRSAGIKPDGFVYRQARGLAILQCSFLFLWVRAGEQHVLKYC